MVSAQDSGSSGPGSSPGRGQDKLWRYGSLGSTQTRSKPIVVNQTEGSRDLHVRRTRRACSCGFQTFILPRAKRMTPGREKRFSRAP